MILRTICGFDINCFVKGRQMQSEYGEYGKEQDFHPKSASVLLTSTVGMNHRCNSALIRYAITNMMPGLV